jgi:hypothetical protein
MQYLLVACQLVLAIVLILAATGKMRFFRAFLGTLSRSKVPVMVIRPLALLIVGGELCLAFGLVLSTPQSLPVVMMVTAWVITLFTIWMVWMRVLGVQTTCSCFGKDISAINARAIARNVLLLIVALIGCILAMRVQTPFISPSVEGISLVLIASLGITLITTFHHRIQAWVHIIRSYQQTHPLASRDVESITKSVPDPLTRLAVQSFSRRSFVKWVIIGTGTVLGLLKVTPALAGQCSRAPCNCYPFDDTQLFADCTGCSAWCADHPGAAECWALAYFLRHYQCCPPDLPVECRTQRQYTPITVFCMECPPSCGSVLVETTAQPQPNC